MLKPGSFKKKICKDQERRKTLATHVTFTYTEAYKAY